MLEIYGFVMLGRFVSVIIDARSGGEAFIARSVAGVVVYLPLVFASFALPWPRLGISRELEAAARSPNSSGIWAEEPHRVIAIGALYFLHIGVAELWVAFRGATPEEHHKIGRPSQPATVSETALPSAPAATGARGLACSILAIPIDWVHDSGGEHRNMSV